MATNAKKTPAETKEAAVKTEAAKEVKAAEVKAEVKAAPVEAPKAEKAAEEKKPAAPKKAPAAKKTAEKKPAAKKTAEKKPAAKKTTKKAAKVLTYEEVVEAAKKKAASANTAKIKYPVAANVEISGVCEGIFFILVNEEGKVSVEPYKYNDYDVYFRIDAEEAVKLFTGKLNVYDALANGILSVDGIAKKAILFVDAVL
ncbi:MAG: SCP2 sterol-binding domain-containing protein [Oscillospiraceae bacterium]|nr:SCP2 sterol-binding domain-containing protein [Oscillospiraceae bacterium]